MVFLVAQTNATNTILAILTIKTRDEIDRVRTVLRKHAMRKLLAIDTFVAKLTFPREIRVNAKF